MTKKVLIIIPCYNEESSLPVLIKQLKQLPVKTGYELSLLVVNDCSEDNTKQIATQPGIILLDLPINLGIGGAVQCGLLYASENKYELAIQMDGDGQHPPHQLYKLLDCFEKYEANIVIGSRFLEFRGFQSSFTRRLGITYFRWLNKVFTGENIYDSTSGFRLFDKKAMKIAAANYPDDYPEPESLLMFSRAGLVIKETPVEMVKRYGGHSSIGGFASLYYGIKVTIAMFFSAIRKVQ